MKNENSSRAAINVIEFYKITIKLKNVIRSGWKQWNVCRSRLETVAEHVYGTCMLAIAMASEFDYDIDIRKVVMMLAIHELEETIIPDITPVDPITPEQKKEMGHNAIIKILSPLASADELIALIFEFDERESADAKFAYQCDKLECDLMAIEYDYDKEVYFEFATSCVRKNQTIRAMYNSGSATTMKDFFYLHDKDKYDENFRAVLEYMYQN